ncbi:MAG TPA: PfkB family carbohydrate kinase [Bryobacteraceae bacterium]|nr:PfkB family carbohydrate kinase [Bryobacteraceae bacterium]
MTAAEILQEIPNISVLVVGDICLDRWCSYDPAAAEPSRETGLPRIGVVSTEVTPGAGGTIANNLRALGVQRVAVVSAVGEDGFGWELIQALNARGVSAELCVKSAAISTFTYTKLINARTGAEDLPRVDFINTRPMPPDVEAHVHDNFQLFARAFDIIIVSDQAETEQGGVIASKIRSAVSAIALEEPGRIVWVDSRMRPELFRNVILKPNSAEADSACQRVFGRIDYPALQKHTNAPFLIVTRGAAGALVVEGGTETAVATRAIGNPVDICGAGDAFSAGAALALAITGSPISAARFGNLVSSVTIMKKGTGTASPEEVLAAEREWAE